MKKLLFISFILVAYLPSFSQKWGIDSSRTETRDDASLQGNAGAVSGFFQTLNPMNYPPGANGWWHLLDVRHSNAASNFSMQFAGSFFDQNLYFRKIANNPAQKWSRILLETDGKMGIGTTVLRAQLDMKFTNANVLSSILGRVAEGDADGDGTYLGVRTLNTQPVDVGTFSIEHGFYGMVNNAITFHRGLAKQGGFMSFSTNNGTEQMRIDPWGNVGIGTKKTNGYKLAVEGAIGARRVRVTQESWADYVFDHTYQLPSLQEVEAYVKTEKHLPGIPSQTEISRDGLDLGDMQKLQMQKIEELTLYVIELNKKLEAQQQLVAIQAKELKKLKEKR
ncbi:MAG TPA: hypothetical protein VM802_04065 [Chitinophaga sp.]|uniref:hypothetical protein n=1 Tax=Chitinophaga sp. TaxID=1869181 RepID=UPI002BAAACFA|nr:hypothetical protein [Chitinophaga sp.]HVI44012.1 hypothetical protein [Chitinophaga sp.]